LIGYLTSSFCLYPPSSQNYDITLASSNPVPIYNLPNVTGFAYFVNSSSLVYFNYTALQSYNISYVVQVFVNGLTITLCNSSSFLLSNSFSCSVASYSGYTAVVYGYANSGLFYSSSYFSLGSSSSLGSNVDYHDGLLLSFFIVALCIMCGVSFGPIGALLMGVLGLFAVFFLGLASFVSISLIIVSIVVSIVIGVKLRT